MTNAISAALSYRSTFPRRPMGAILPRRFSWRTAAGVLYRRNVAASAVVRSVTVLGPNQRPTKKYTATSSELRRYKPSDSRHRPW